ncbi:MAG TPA: sigma 54-interacting transcriptional regulator [Candidatus Paceibacterota bacterium]|nr:sigma 54-interacting transcriptional regulator [Candidatus Paceibacterota bacterium]
MTANIDGAGQAVTTDAIPISELGDGHEFFQGFVVANTEMFGICGKVEFFARNEQYRTILIEGQTGTGKELLAKLVFNRSGKRGENRHIFNCANVYHSVFDSDLFGHRRGSFTGAERDRKGILEAANHGFLFLDEVSRLSPNKQAKLLRFLENGTVRPLGTNEEIPLDVRLVIATNQDLGILVAEGKFLPDLYYRISKIRCRVPPLSERLDEIRPLVKTFARNLGVGHQSIESSSLDFLMSNPWPGNVRELESVVERAVFRCQYERREVIGISKEDVYPPEKSTVHTLLSPKEFRRQEIMKALAEAGGNKSKAAEILGISRSVFYRRIQRNCPDLFDFS